MTYSLDFREKVLLFRKKECLSYTELSKRFGIDRQTIFRWSKNPTPKTKRKKNAVKIDMEALKEDVRENPDLYQYERAKKFKVSQNCIHKALKRLGITYKKNVETPQSRRRKAYVIPKEN